MSLLEDLAAERKARLIRLGTIPAPKLVIDENAARISSMSTKLEEMESIVEELRTVISRQRELIRKFADESEMPIPLVNDILMTVAEYYNVTKTEIVGLQRPHRFVLPRQIIYFLASEWGYSYPHIGRACNRDHTTCLYGANRTRKKLETDAVLRSHIGVLRDRVNAYSAARIELSKAALG
jgi:chromosomal replication initiation ATPase DnaA